jgi:hypothetical protein
MGQERLPVNIFPGVLPGAYLFLDDFEDASKWTNAGHGIGGWASVTAGDAFGYYGGGLRFVMNNAIGSQGAVRSLLAPNLDSFYLGAQFRPSYSSYIVTPNFKDYNIRHTYRSANTNREYLVTMRCQLTMLGGRNITLILTTGGVATTIATIAMPYPGIGTWPQWGRIRMAVVDNVIRRIDFNTFTYTPNITIAIDAAGIYQYNMLEVIGIQAQASGEHIDIDQIWISDTENRV